MSDAEPDVVATQQPRIDDFGPSTITLHSKEKIDGWIGLSGKLKGLSEVCGKGPFHLFWVFHPYFVDRGPQEKVGGWSYFPDGCGHAR